MNPVAVTADLLHDLVAGSHAEAVTALAVAPTIDHDSHILLIIEPGHDVIDATWELPTGRVLPGETLHDALANALAVLGLNLDEITAYLGHHDRYDTNDGLTRVFGFAVTVTNPHSICRSARIRHWWADPAELPDPHAPAVLSPAPRASQEPSLAAALRTCARHHYTAQAGTELLIRHAIWLHRSDFCQRFVHTTTDNAELATIDWRAAITALDTGELPCSSSEGRMLRLAASLADGIPVSLCDALTGLDAGNTDLISRAVSHATGQAHQPRPPHRSTIS